MVFLSPRGERGSHIDLFQNKCLSFSDKSVCVVLEIEKKLATQCRRERDGRRLF